MAQSPWTDERIALLQKLCGEGLSAADMAFKINVHTGSDFTRNAIIGAVIRRKFSRPHIKPRDPNKPKRRQGNDNNFAWRVSVRRSTVRTAPVFEPEPELPPAEFLGLTFEQLDNAFKLCRYPRGDDPATMLFCGQPVKRDADGNCISSYCIGCHRLAYHKPQPQNRDTYSQIRGAA